jgi:hypothetical protein
MWKWVVLRGFAGALLGGLCAASASCLTACFAMSAYGIRDGMVLNICVVFPFPSGAIAGLCGAVSRKWFVGAVVGLGARILPLDFFSDATWRWLDVWVVDVPLFVGPPVAGAFAGALFACSVLRMSKSNLRAECGAASYS